MRYTADTINDDELDRLYAERDRLIAWVADLQDMPEDWVRARLGGELAATAAPKEASAS